MRDVIEHVEPRDALIRQELRGVALWLLQNRREDVADIGFAPLGALHVKNCRLQHAAERQCLFGIVV